MVKISEVTNGKNEWKRKGCSSSPLRMVKSWTRDFEGVCVHTAIEPLVSLLGVFWRTFKHVTSSAQLLAVAISSYPHYFYFWTDYEYLIDYFFVKTVEWTPSKKQYQKKKKESYLKILYVIIPPMTTWTCCGLVFLYQGLKEMLLRHRVALRWILCQRSFVYKRIFIRKHFIKSDNLEDT